MTSTDGVRVMRALGHPLRYSIFELIGALSMPVSARDVRHGLDDHVSLGVVAFHLGNLETAGLLTIAHVAERTRAREQFFVLSERGRAVRPVAAALMRAARQTGG